jgi:hypothetical protein
MQLRPRFRNPWISGVILSILCGAVLSAEIHGVVGHLHHGQANSSRQMEADRASSTFHLARLEKDHEDTPCSLCFCYRLLAQSLIPKRTALVDALFVVRAISIRHFCLVQTSVPQEENRGPPLA